MALPYFPLKALPADAELDPGRVERLITIAATVLAVLVVAAIAVLLGTA